MTLTELAQRAMAGEVVGDGAAQVRVLADCIRETGQEWFLLAAAAKADGIEARNAGEPAEKKKSQCVKCGGRRVWRR